MNIVNDILAQYKDIIGQFMSADAVLVRIRNKIASDRTLYGAYEPEYERMRAEYDLLDRTLNAVLDRVSLIRFGRGAEVSFTEIINGLVNFASRGETLLKDIGKMETRLFGSTKITGMRNPALGLLPIAGVAFIVGNLVGNISGRKRQ